jgi:biotin carboxyl carrier protein
MAKYEVSIDGQQYEVEILRDDGSRALLKIDGREYKVDARNVSTGSVPSVRPAPGSRPAASRRSPLAAAQPEAGAGAIQIVAPMPGLVLEVCASVGQQVKNGEALLRLEAMKMENDIQSHNAGTVTEILVAQGDDVQEGQLLMVLEN